MATHKRNVSPEELRYRLGCDNPFIVEAGAHDGSDTVTFLQHFPQSQVVSFECDPRPIVRFKEQLSPYQFSRRSLLVEAAVSDKPGTHEFHQSTGSPRSKPHITDWDHSSSLLQPTGHHQFSPWCKFKPPIQVPTVTLDGWMADNPQWSPSGRVDLLWADLQGAEHLLINGARKTLARTRFVHLEFFENPLYAGQHNLQQLLELLGTDWELLNTYEKCNLLAVNRRIN